MANCHPLIRDRFIASRSALKEGPEVGARPKSLVAARWIQQCMLVWRSVLQRPKQSEVRTRQKGA
eukprot:1716992-Pleurochrysis_carterae.AAC.1